MTFVKLFACLCENNFHPLTAGPSYAHKPQSASVPGLKVAKSRSGMVPCPFPFSFSPPPCPSSSFLLFVLPFSLCPFPVPGGPLHHFHLWGVCGSAVSPHPSGSRHNMANKRFLVHPESKMSHSSRCSSTGQVFG